jgi:hypothetical protein
LQIQTESLQWSNNYVPIGGDAADDMRAVHGTTRSSFASNTNGGTLVVLVDSGAGYQRAATSEQGPGHRPFGNGELVLDACYQDFRGVRVFNPTSNDWTGRVRYSRKGSWLGGLMPGADDSWEHLVCDVDCRSDHRDPGVPVDTLLVARSADFVAGSGTLYDVESLMLASSGDAPVTLVPRVRHCVRITTRDWQRFESAGARNGNGWVDSPEGRLQVGVFYNSDETFEEVAQEEAGRSRLVGLHTPYVVGRRFAAGQVVLDECFDNFQSVVLSTWEDESSPTLRSTDGWAGTVEYAVQTLATLFDNLPFGETCSTYSVEGLSQSFTDTTTPQQCRERCERNSECRGYTTVAPGRCPTSYGHPLRDVTCRLYFTCSYTDIGEFDSCGSTASSYRLASGGISPYMPFDCVNCYRETPVEVGSSLMMYEQYVGVAKSNIAVDGNQNVLKYRGGPFGSNQGTIPSTYYHCLGGQSCILKPRVVPPGSYN